MIMVLLNIFINIFIITTINNCIINNSTYNIIDVFLSMPIGFRLSSCASIVLTATQMLFFIGILIFMSLYARGCLKKACILYALVIHFVWFIGNVLSMIEIEAFEDLNLCVFWAMDSIHILQRDSQYWRKLGRLIMQTNISCESICDRSVNTGQSFTMCSMSHEQVFSRQLRSNNNTNTNNSNDKTLYKHKSSEIIFDQINDVTSMYQCLILVVYHLIIVIIKIKIKTTHGRDDSNAPSMVCIDTSAAVLGCDQGKKVAIKSIICDELDFQIVYNGNGNLSSIINAGINIGVGAADRTDSSSTNQLTSMDSPITNDPWTPDREITMTNNSSNTITRNLKST